MEKKALDPISAAVMGHLGVNVGVRALRSAAGKAVKRKGAGFKGLTTKARKPLADKAGNWFRGKNVAQWSKGIREGVSGELPSIKSEMGKNWVAPEVFEGRILGKEVGHISRAVPKRVRYKALKKIRKRVAQTPELRDDPLLQGQENPTNPF